MLLSARCLQEGPAPPAPAQSVLLQPGQLVRMACAPTKGCTCKGTMLCCSHTVLAACREAAGAWAIQICQMDANAGHEQLLLAAFRNDICPLAAPAQSTSSTCTGPENMATHRTKQTSTPLLAACREAGHTASCEGLRAAFSVYASSSMLC